MVKIKIKNKIDTWKIYMPNTVKIDKIVFEIAGGGGVRAHMASKVSIILDRTAWIAL